MSKYKLYDEDGVFYYTIDAHDMEDAKRIAKLFSESYGMNVVKLEPKEGDLEDKGD